jgi:hypothetical protein
MSIECIEYFTPEGILIARYINGDVYEATQEEVDNSPFLFERKIITKEDYDKTYTKKKK